MTQQCISKRCRAGFERLRYQAAWLLLAGDRAWAQIAQPAIDGSSGIMSDIRSYIRSASELLIYVVLLGGYITAAYMIISGAVRLFTDREGGVQRFLLGIFVAILMVILMTYFLNQSETALENLK